MMKTYLAKFTIFHGEHEHQGAFLLYAKNIIEAEQLAKSQEHGQQGGYFDNNDIQEEELTYWD